MKMQWGDGKWLGKHVRKKKKKEEEGGTCLRHTPRWLAKSGEKFLDPPPLYVFVGGKVVGS